MSTKDKVSNWVAIAAAAAGVVQIVVVAWNDYVAANPDPTVDVNWIQLLLTITVAVIGYLTGKSPNLKGSAQ